MAVQLILKNSSVEDKRPTAAQLANGEISLNYNEAGAFLCCKDTDGNIQQVGGIKVDDDAPGSPVYGTLWLKPSTSTLFIHDGTTWQAISGGSGGGTGGAIDQLVAGDGIDITPASGVGVVTVDNDIDTNRGLEFVAGRTAVKIGKGLEFDGATGSINATATALTFKGTVDLTTPGDVPADPELGDSYVNVGDGAFDAEWATATGEDPTTEANPGDLVVWNGTIWVYIPIGTAPSGADLDYAPTTGTASGTGGTVLSTFGTDAVIPMAGHAQAGVLGGAAQAGLMKPEDRTLLDSLPVDGGEFEQVQSNWDETDITDPSYIQNKPEITVDGNDDITNVNVDLDYTAAADKGTVTNNRGTDAEIPFATAAEAGLFIEPATPGAGTVQYARQVTDRGVASWEEIDESSSVTVGETPPASPEVGDLWWDSSDDSGRLYVWYVDGDSGQWVETSPAAPTPPEVTTYWDKTGNDLEPKENTDNVNIGDGKITLNAADGVTLQTGQSFAGSDTYDKAAFVGWNNTNQGTFIGINYADGGKVFEARDGFTDPTRATSLIYGDGSIAIGGVPESAPNITLNAATGDINTTGQLYSGLYDGVGLIRSNRSGDEDNFALVVDGAAERSFGVFGTGTTVIGGDFSTASPNIKLDVSGAGLFMGDVGVGFYGRFGANYRGGSITKDGTLILYKDYVASDPATVKVIDINAAGNDTGGTYSERATIYADGSAIFRGASGVKIYNDPSVGVGIGLYAGVLIINTNVTGNSAFQIKNSTLNKDTFQVTGNGRCFTLDGFTVQNSTAFNDVIKLNNDGTSSFAGLATFSGGTSGATGRAIELNGDIGIQLEPNDPANYTTDVDEEGNETETYIGPTLDVKETIETAAAERTAMRETFQELLVAVQAATDFGQLKAAMLVALEDYA